MSKAEDAEWRSYAASEEAQMRDEAPSQREVDEIKDLEQEAYRQREEAFRRDNGPTDRDMVPRIDTAYRGGPPVIRSANTGRHWF